LRERAKERYAGAARFVLEGAGSSSCCGSAGERGLDSEALEVDWTGGGYSAEELGGLPEAAGAASLGCGNPTALATLSPGEVVLDLGSGSGIDVLLSARRVSPGGKAYGVDMTDEMLELARNNALLEAPPRHPLRDRDHRPLPRAGGGGRPRQQAVRLRVWEGIRQHPPARHPLPGPIR
jgi:SAM-dependent methyltransferase